jgi:hypothetical protein
MVAGVYDRVEAVAYFKIVLIFAGSCGGKRREPQISRCSIIDSKRAVIKYKYGLCDCPVSKVLILPTLKQFLLLLFLTVVRNKTPAPSVFVHNRSYAYPRRPGAVFAAS